MKFLVIGYGSIGKRHARNIKSLGHEVIVLRHSRDTINKDGFDEYYSYEEVLKSVHSIDGAIVCSPTSCHLNDVTILVDNNIPFLLEKPPTVDYKSCLEMIKYFKQREFSRYDIGFNLRFYPALKFIKEYIPNLGHIYAARVSAGYYLPDWRKNVDYRTTNSAKKELGGGVHIELIHEIDYIIWFFGLPEKVFGYTNRISTLEISTEDICVAVFQYGDGSVVELHLDYLSHKNLRGCQIIAEHGTMEWNFIEGKVKLFVRGQKIPEELLSLDEGYDFNKTYIEELENFIGVVIRKKNRNINIQDAVDSMKVVEAIKLSSEKGKWIDIKEAFN
ncbi:MAG: Gfo/Idh/MocA family oxidoreductase [Candidatus Scalindua sp.]|jgi:predicted dehydrogenase|nr:Gfo/Idh/MocA family oxidoreductase [Candidatus Scalindua sp.]